MVNCALAVSFKYVKNIDSISSGENCFVLPLYSTSIKGLSESPYINIKEEIRRKPYDKSQDIGNDNITKKNKRKPW